MEDINIYQSKTKLTITISLSAIFLLLIGCVALYAGITESEMLVIILGVFMLLLVAFGMIRYVRMMRAEARLLVRITAEGFYDYTNKKATGDLLIPWSAVKSITKQHRSLLPYVSLNLSDPRSFSEQIPDDKWKSIVANSAMGLGNIGMFVNSANGYRTKDILRLMRKYKTQATS